MALEKKMVCKFCNREFERPKWFEKHMCDKKKRFERRNNIESIKAHRFFQHWQTRSGLNRRGRAKDFEEFVKSPFYNRFIELARFTMQEYVVSAYRYIDWLIEKEMPDFKWCDSRNLDEYREYLRENEDPVAQTEKSCQNIKVWCERKRVPIKDFFRVVTPGQALNMVREDRLSPWVLLAYDKCVQELTDRMEGEVLHTLNDHINVKYWIDKVEAERSDTVRVNEICDRFMDANA